MASSKPIPCGSCQAGEENIKAKFWCYDCEEGLCSTCSGHHKKFQSRHHKTIDIESFKPSHIETICDKHYKQLTLYCNGHLMPCCDECVSTSHSKCTGIKSLASVLEKTEIEKSKESLDKDIHIALHILMKIVINKSGNIKRGEQQYESIKKTIEKYREKINNHLDHLEKKLYHEIDTILIEQKSEISNLIAEIEEKSEKLKEMKDQLNAITTQVSKLQSFLGIYQIGQQVHQCQQYVKYLEDDDRAKEFDIKMKHNDELDKTLSILGSLESLGVVIVEKTVITVNRNPSVNREAQVQSLEQSNINNMTMTIDTKININIGKPISDMICLIDGRAIVIEHLGKVNLLTSDGKLEKQLPITGDAFSVTQINQDTIAITYPKEQAIKIFNMENETVTKVIPFQSKCMGLSFCNNSLTVGLGTTEIRIIDLEGNTQKSIKVQSESLLQHIVTCNDRVIYSDYNGKAVKCVDGSSKQIWQYKKDLASPSGICIDTNGNILVADIESSRIIVISKDGHKSKVLISEIDRLHSPKFLCLKQNESSGFICEIVGKYVGKYIAKFNLLSE